MGNRLTRWYARWIDALHSSNKVITILWDIMLLEESILDVIHFLYTSCSVYGAHELLNTALHGTLYNLLCT